MEGTKCGEACTQTFADLYLQLKWPPQTWEKLWTNVSAKNCNWWRTNLLNKSLWKQGAQNSKIGSSSLVMIVPSGTALTTTALHTPMSHENVTEKLIDKLTKHVYIWLKNLWFRNSMIPLYFMKLCNTYLVECISQSVIYSSINLRTHNRWHGHGLFILTKSNSLSANQWGEDFSMFYTLLLAVRISVKQQNIVHWIYHLFVLLNSLLSIAFKEKSEPGIETCKWFINNTNTTMT